MSWAHVQGTGASASGAGGTLAATFGSSVTVGNLIVVSISTYNQYASSVADNKGGSNTYTLADRTTDVTGDSTLHLETWYAVVATGGTGLQVTVSNNYSSLAIDEFSLAGTLSVDATAINWSPNSLGTVLTSGNLTLTGTDLIHCVGCNYTDAVTLSPSSGFTAGYTSAGVGGQFIGIGVEYQLNVSSSPINPGFTSSSNGYWACIGVAFLETVSSVDGSIAVTLGNDTLSGSAGFLSPSSAAITLGSDTFAGLAGFLSPASAAITLGSDVFVGSSGFATAGTVALTLSDDTFVGSAGFATAGAVALTLSDDVFVGSSGFANAGALVLTLSDDVFVGSAGFATAGSAAITLGSDTFVGVASGSSVTGSMALTLGSDSFVGAASFATSASAVFTLNSDTFIGSAGFSTTASIVITLGADIFVGVAGGSTIPLLSYVDATKSIVIFEDDQVSEIAPEKATIYQ